jgi:nucleotide-binding universal stress UspA family protein
MTERIQIERILCPTDFSEFSVRALRHATALARRFGARLTVLHVIPQWVPYTHAPAYFPGPMLANPALCRHVEQDVREFAAPAIEAGVPVETMLREAEPWREIQAVAEELPADLVVMGTHGRGGFEQLLLGAVAEKVLRRAPCPVLTVCHEEGRTWEAPGLIRRILCATDLSEASGPTIRYALSLAEEYEAAVTFLHVLEGVPGGDDPAYKELPETASLLRQIESVAREQLRTAIPADARNWCDVSERIVPGRAHQEVLRVAVEESADLIVMGARLHGLFARTILGSTSHRVVREASCPVLTVRPLAGQYVAEEPTETALARSRT